MIWGTATWITASRLFFAELIADFKAVAALLVIGVWFGSAVDLDFPCP